MFAPQTLMYSSINVLLVFQLVLIYQFALDLATTRFRLSSSSFQINARYFEH